MRRLLLMTIDFPPKTGGVARYLDGLARYFCDQITVVVPPMNGTEKLDAGMPYKVERRSLLSFKFWPRWIDAVKALVQMRNSYETVITSHVLPIGLAALVAKAITRRPYIVIVHGLDVALVKQSSRKYWAAKLVLNQAKLVVANSYALKEELERDFGVTRSLVVYPSAPQAAHEPLEHAGTRFLTVSRLVERKGHIRVLNALARLRDQGKLENVVYTIVGDGPMEQKIYQTVRELKLDEVVEMRHGVDDQELAKLYATSDVFVMPTMVIDEVDREGFGIVYLEAAAYGIPSIASKLPGPDEAVLNDKTGLLVEDGNIEALAEAMETLATNTMERTRLGTEAKLRADSEFRPAYQFKKLEAQL